MCPATFVSSLEEGTVTINCTLDYSGPEQPDLTMKDSTPEDAPGLEVKKGYVYFQIILSCQNAMQ